MICFFGFLVGIGRIKCFFRVCFRMKKRFCPRCGATDRPFVRGFCVDCFLQTHRLVELPQNPQFSVCRECGKILLEGKWFSFSKEKLLGFVQKKIRVLELTDFKIALDLAANATPAGWLAPGTVVGHLDSEFVSWPIQIPVQSKDSLCRDCSLIKADYFEAELQLRFSKKSKDLKERLIKKVQGHLSELRVHDSLAQISGIGNTPGGVDIKIGSKRAGKLVAERLHREMGGEIKHSYSLAGVDKSGRTRKRFTFLVRLK